ncbi:MAG: trypsin-like peptidase domain-containing protein [Terricaulis sp.]
MRNASIVAGLSLAFVFACSPPATTSGSAVEGTEESAAANADAPTPRESEISALPVYAPEISDVASICGAETDYVDVRAFAGKNGVTPQFVTAHAPSAVMFRWVDLGAMRAAYPGYQYGNVAGQHWCSGTLIADESAPAGAAAHRVLTAGHCFFSANGSDGWVTPYRVVNGQREYLQDEALARLQTVVFDFEIVGGRPREGESRNITGIDFDSTHALDYAIVEFAGAAPGNRAPAQVSRTNARVNDPLIIIQHPGGAPKKIDVGTLFQLVPRAAPVEMRYNDIDTIGGSSGSGIRNAAGAIVGVHVAGGCDRGIGNEGVPIEAIRDRARWL